MNSTLLSDLESFIKDVEELDTILDETFGMLKQMDMEQILSINITLVESFVKYYTFSAIPPYNFLLIETILHACICAIGYFGNVITCIVILSNLSMRTTTNIYLFNLAIADLIMLTSGLINYTIACWKPYKAEHLSKYSMKGCFFFNWVSDVAVNISIMTITAFTIERYLAICHPFFARVTLSVSKTIKLIFLMWMIGTLFGYINFSKRDVLYMKDEDNPLCIDDLSGRYIVEIETLIFFVLPFIIITVLYCLIWKQLVDSSKIQKNQGSHKMALKRPVIHFHEDTNRQILKMLVTVVAVFFFVWAPYHFVRILLLHLENLPYDIFFLRDHFSNIDLYLESTYLMVYFSSSAINPIIYNIMSKQFRHAFKRVFKCCGSRVAIAPRGKFKLQAKSISKPNTEDTVITASAI